MQKTSSPVHQYLIKSLEAQNAPLVSIVVTTKNEEKNIGSCLKSIMAQTFKNVELIVVDNFSKDKTVEIAQKYGAEVYLKGPERSSQRNCGAHVSNGKYVLYLDADMILSPTVIEECVKKCEDEKIDGIYIPERIIGQGFWIKVRDFERSFYTGTIIDAVRFIRRDLFEKLKGFDESLVGPEDWDFDRRIREIGRTGVISTVLYHNEGQFNMRGYLKKKEYYSNGIKKYIKKWGSNDPDIVKQLGAQYRLLGAFVENGKWKNLFKHPMFLIGLYCLRLSVAIGYLRNTKTLMAQRNDKLPQKKVLLNT